MRNKQPFSSSEYLTQGDRAGLDSRARTRVGLIMILAVPLFFQFCLGGRWEIGRTGKAPCKMSGRFQTNPCPKPAASPCSPMSSFIRLLTLPVSVSLSYLGGDGVLSRVIPSSAAIFVRISPYFLNSFLRYKISPNNSTVSERNVRWDLALKEEEKRKSRMPLSPTDQIKRFYQNLEIRSFLSNNLHRGPAVFRSTSYRY